MSVADRLGAVQRGNREDVHLPRQALQRAFKLLNRVPQVCPEAEDHLFHVRAFPCDGAK